MLKILINLATCCKLVSVLYMVTMAVCMLEP